MERNEIIAWALKGLENEIIKLDSSIYNAKHDIRRIENGDKYVGGNLFKTRERLMRDIERKEELERKAFELKFERDLNE